MTTQNNDRRGLHLGSLLLGTGIGALLARPDARETIAKSAKAAVGSALETAQDTYHDSVKPLAEGALERAGDLTQDALSRGQDLAQSALSRGAQTAGSLAHSGADLAQSVVENVQGGAKTVAAAVGLEAAQSVAKGKKMVDRTVKQGRQAGKAAKKGAAVALVAGQTARQGAKGRLTRAEKQANKKLMQYERRMAVLEAKLAARKRRSGGGGLVWLAALVGGGVVLARVPKARQAILDAVGSVSPEAAQSLRSAGRSARDIVGSVWLERIEPESAPAPAAPQAGAGSAAYASAEPGTQNDQAAKIDANVSLDATRRAAAAEEQRLKNQEQGGDKKPGSSDNVKH